MMFYVLFAAGMMLPGRYLGLAATGLGLAAAVAAGRILEPANPVLQFYLQPVVLEFAAGMALGAILPCLTISPAWRWPAAGVGAAGLALMLADGWLFPDVERALIFGAPAVVIVAACVIAERAGLRAGQAWVQLLGAASYAVYLTHFFCTQVVVKLFERLHVHGPAALAGFPLALALVALAGVLAHRRLELPLTELARRCFVPRAASPPAASAIPAEPST